MVKEYRLPLNLKASLIGLTSKTPFLHLLFFFSGATGLIYEVLWMKELELLFGATSYAVATTLSVFFLGLSLGGYYWGKISKTLKSPLKVYAFLEFGVAVAGVLYFFILDAYRAMYSTLFQLFQGTPAVFIAVKFFLSLGLLFLPAFFMGGTFPVLGQYLIRRPGELAMEGTLLYAINTFGAASGAFLAGFVLPCYLGFKDSYLLTIGANVLIGVCALVIAGNTQIERTGQDCGLHASPATGQEKKKDFYLACLSFFSGFLTLGLEVIWIRLFSQALFNTVYIFSSMLISFLLALALGSCLAKLLTKTRSDPRMALTFLFTLSGIAVINSPGVFFLTGGLNQPSHAMAGWVTYIFSIFKSMVPVIWPPVILMGSILPFLFKVIESSCEKPGFIIGRLVAINMAGGLFGSLFAGFVFLKTFGLWSSINIFGLLYLIQAFLLVFLFRGKLKERLVVTLALVFAVLIVIVKPFPFPLISFDPEREEVLEVMEGSHSTVAVIKEEGDLTLRVNNYYGLGRAKNFHRQRFQAELPLLIHPAAKSIFFLGLGTGITTGASLCFPVEDVLVCELIPEVAFLSKKYFSPLAPGLFKDPRVSVILEDGRNFLLGTKKKYDLIVADLFLPFKAGAGSLYTLEHFQTVRTRLKEDGLFVQWLPINQFAMGEFEIFARTILEAFDLVTIWRIDYHPKIPFFAFVAYNNPQALDAEGLAARAKNYNGVKDFPLAAPGKLKASILALYCGNLSHAGKAIPPGPINTEDTPLIEYRAPMSMSEMYSGKLNNISEEALYGLLSDIARNGPFEKDPYLKNLSDEEIGYIRAGLDLMGYQVYKDKNKAKALEFSKSFMEAMGLNEKSSLRPGQK